MPATCNGKQHQEECTGRDNLVSKDYGPYHQHKCTWCRGFIDCHNGPDCDVGDDEMHCDRECYEHRRPYGSQAGFGVGL